MVLEDFEDFEDFEDEGWHERRGTRRYGGLKRSRGGYANVDKRTEIGKLHGVPELKNVEPSLESIIRRIAFAPVASKRKIGKRPVSWGVLVRRRCSVGCFERPENESIAKIRQTQRQWGA